MPRVKSAKGLYEICIQSLNSVLKNVVSTLERKHGTYSNLICQIHLQNIHEVLISNLPRHILDAMLHKISLPNGFGDNKKVMLLALFIHPEIKYIVPNFKLPPYDAFYISQLSKLNKLIVLDLTMVCTDEILKIVGDSCPLLEEIRIVSKVESITSKTRNELNALKLKLFVSDEGLKHIHQCENLKRIIMNKILRSNCGGRKITHEGIRDLLISLPHLQYLSYSNLGLVLEEGCSSLKPLNLLSIQDGSITQERMAVYCKLCPKLKEIRLKGAITTINWIITSGCITMLTFSSLKPQILELGFFPFACELKQFFVLKGIYLTSFTIFYGSNINTESLMILGKHCPNLKCLELKILERGKEDHNINVLKYKYFTQLEKLQLSGVDWDPCLIFPLCIHNAKDLKTLGLINKQHNVFVDNSFERLIEANPLLYLERVCLHEGFKMAEETLERFILSCPRLGFMTLWEKLCSIELLENLKAQNNFEIQFQYESEGMYASNCQCYNCSSSLFFF